MSPKTKSRSRRRPSRAVSFTLIPAVQFDAECVGCSSTVAAGQPGYYRAGSMRCLDCQAAAEKNLTVRRALRERPRRSATPNRDHNIAEWSAIKRVERELDAAWKLTMEDDGE